MDGHLIRGFDEVRAATEMLASRLSPEDMVLQSMPDASPAKWHLAHTSWFFEEFVLSKRAGYQPFDPAFRFLFNSYYDGVGERHARPIRGIISRPSVEEVRAYRRHVESALREILPKASEDERRVITVGIHHEQQHQELLLTDIKHAFSLNVLRAAYLEGCAPRSAPNSERARHSWLAFDEGLLEIGHDGEEFSFDNERPRHRVFVERFEIAGRLVTCGEYLRFMEENGYSRSELWLSDGWELGRREGWRAPLYWEERDGRWWLFTLGGLREVDPAEPVCHVSYYEADAFARWAGARLPTEAEWEVAASDQPLRGNLLESARYHPAATEAGTQFFGDVWEWTRSAYSEYPGFKPFPGVLGEYNAKFMSNQMVLRGGSCVTPASHIRPSYRNFFPPSARWQFSGIRLAR